MCHKFFVILLKKKDSHFFLTWKRIPPPPPPPPPHEWGFSTCGPTHSIKLLCRQTSHCSTQLTFPQVAVQTNQSLLHTTHIPTSCCADKPVAAPDISHSHKLLCRQTSCCSRHLTFPQVAVQTNQLLLQTSHISTSCCADKPVAAPDNSHSHKLLCRQTSCCSRQLTFPPRLACHTLQTARHTQDYSCP